MGNLLCSVVIPAYNAEKTIAFALESAMAQTVADLEIIVSDDGSKDSTRDVVHAFMEKDERIRLVETPENTGVAGARNRGVQAARSDFIAFLDSDDGWKPEKLEKQLSLAVKTGAGIVYTGASCIDAEGKPVEREFRVPETVTLRDILSGNDIICSSALVRKELLLRHPMGNSHLHEDYITWIGILGDGESAAGIAEPLVIYRIDIRSKSGNKLRSAKMQWETYKEVKIPFFSRLGYMMRYAAHGIKRYVL